MPAHHQPINPEDEDDGTLNYHLGSQTSFLHKVPRLCNRHFCVISNSLTYALMPMFLLMNIQIQWYPINMPPSASRGLFKSRVNPSGKI